MADTPMATCARCHETKPRRGVRWPEGFVCRRCYQGATRRRGTCPGCRTDRLLPGLDKAGQQICSTCALLPVDLRCGRCGEEDEPHRRGLCARCCLRDDLSVLLDDGTGQVRPALRPVLEAFCAQELPRSAIIYLRNRDVLRMLGGFARGTTPITHESFDAEPVRRTAMHLRELFIKAGVLPARDRTIMNFQNWLADTTAGYSPAVTRLVTEFATWHHLRRMRADSEAGRLKPGGVQNAQQQITVAAQLLGHLEDLGIPFDQARQQHLDAWLAPGPSTRYVARNFVIWAIASRRLPPLNFPRRIPGGPPILTQEERLRLLRRFLHTDDQPLAYRVAAVILLLLAQPVTRIVRLRLKDVVVSGSTLALRFGEDPAVLPDPAAWLLREHLDSRPNTNTAAGANSPWLSPVTGPDSLCTTASS